MVKDVFGASDVARICRMSRQTVNRWLHSGTLRGFRATKTSDWKITRKELVQFMKNSGIPLYFFEEEVKTKVLVVDDENSITNLILQALRHDERILAEAANSGFSAGIKLENFKPDVVILDIFLGDMDGREFFDYIRRNPDHAGTKVIGMTGLLDESTVEELLNQGFDAFLLKPFDVNVLRRRIHEVVEENMPLKKQ